MLAAALAACGGGGGDGDDAGSGTAPPPPAPPASSASSPATTIAGPDGASLHLPEGALAQPAPTVRIAKDASAAPPLPAAFAPAGDVFAITPDALDLQILGTLRIPVDPALPDETAVAIAESNADGTWTLRTDARIDGAMLEIVVSRLASYRVVREATAALGKRAAAPDKAGAGAATRKFVPLRQEIVLSAPGFVEADIPFSFTTLPVLKANTPFRGIGAVPLTVRAQGPLAGAFCAQAASIDWQYYNLSSSLTLTPASNAGRGYRPPSAGPWEVGFGTWRPVRGVPEMLAAVTVSCVDASGAAYAVRASRMLRYDVDTTSDPLRLSAPGFVDIDNGPTFTRLLARTTPFPGPTTVPVTIAAHSACSVGVMVQIEYYTTADLQVVFAESFALPAPPRAAPWTFDLRAFNAGTGGTVARISLQCRDAVGETRVLTADRLVLYSVADDTSIGFLVQPADASVPAGAGASFRVRVAGGPAYPTERDGYRLFWERSDDAGAGWRPVTTVYQYDTPTFALPGVGHEHVLALPATVAADNGALVRARACYAPPGQVERCVLSRPARLEVLQALVTPQVVRQPRGMATLVGETATFDVAVAGTPAPAVRWQRLAADATNWIDIGSAAAWPGTTGNAATLVTPAGTLADDGTLLRAVVANLAGEVASNPVAWRVTAAPMATAITLQPLDARTVLGGSATFAAIAEGTAPLSYQWFRNGAPIAGATAPVLAIANVQAADLASYRLTVSGPGGSALSRDASLSASSALPPATPPVIQQQPRPQGVALGGSATFTIAVTGDPAPWCQWTRNGIGIPGATSCTGYTTPAASAADNGAVYNVVAWNAGGLVLGGGAVLTVALPPAAGWTMLPSNTSTLLYDIAVVAPRDRLVAVGYDGDVRLSLDGGASWSVQHHATDPSKYLRRLAFADAQVGLALGARAILRTADGGATWQEVLSQDVADPLVGGEAQDWQALAWRDANTVVALGLRRVWISSDRGATWRLHGSFDVATTGAGAINAMSFADATTGMAASDYRLLRTTDGGLTWSHVADPYTTFTDPLYGVAPGAGGTWVATGGTGLYRSTDGGATWTRRDIAEVAGRPAYALGLKARGPEMVISGDSGLVLSSNDAGSAWTAQPSLPFGALMGVDFVPGNGNRPIWVVGAGGLTARLD